MSHLAPAATSSRRWSTARVALTWFLAKAVVFSIWIGVAPGVQGDPRYYAAQISMLAERGPQGVLVEYPTPVIWILSLPLLLVGGHAKGYVYAFIAAMILLDGAFAWLLWRTRDAQGRRDPLAVLWWVAFTFVIGPTAFMRFDLLTAVLAGAALLLLGRRRPVLAGACLGLGAAIKLWPALLWLATLGRRDRWRSSAGFWATGGGLALASWVWAGWDRLVSPLTWQSDRGLQVESVWATVPMIGRLFTDRWNVSKSPYNAYEVFGPGVDAWLAVATVATGVGLLLLLGVVLVWLRSPARADLLTAGLVMLLVTTVMIVTNKTFSPQYVMWLGGPLAAMLAIAPRQARSTEPWLRHLGWAVLGITVCTQLVYPILYGQLVHEVMWATPLVTFFLVVRNLALLALAGWLAVLVVRRSGGLR